MSYRPKARYYVIQTQGKISHTDTRQNMSYRHQTIYVMQTPKYVIQTYDMVCYLNTRKQTQVIQTLGRIDHADSGQDRSYRHQHQLR